MAKPNPLRRLAPLAMEPGPQRIFGVSLLVNTVGAGFVASSMTLYYIHVVHLSTRQVGIGLTIAGVISLLAGIPLGDLADRRGPTTMMRLMTLLEAVITAGYLFIHSFAVFVVVATADMIAVRAAVASGGPVIRRIGGDQGTAFQAAIHSIANLGIALGALGCGVALEIGTANAYRALVAANALSYLISWLIMLRLPRYEPLPRPDTGPRWGALTDKPFVAYSLLSGAMSVQYYVIPLLLPLWALGHTHAPRWSVGAFLLLNTLIVVAFQVRVGKDITTIQRGGTALCRAGLVFLLSCAGFALAVGVPAIAALAILVAAVVVHTYGELWYSSGSFAFDYGMPPAHAQGQYQAVGQIGVGAGQAVAPALLIGLALRFGRVGWVGLGVCFTLLGLVAPIVAAWGVSTRPQAEGAKEIEPAAQVD
jgi:MFS family permease